MNDGTFSQSKIVKTSQFVFKPTNIGLLFEKYCFRNYYQTLNLKKTNKYFHKII